MTTTTFTLRSRRSLAMLKALAMGSLPWVILAVIVSCLINLSTTYFLGEQIIVRNSVADYAHNLVRLNAFISGCVVIILLMFTHSALDEMRANFPAYELYFPIKVAHAVTLHLLYKVLVWVGAYYAILWSCFQVPMPQRMFIMMGNELAQPIFPLILILAAQQIAWWSNNVMRIFFACALTGIMSLWFSYENDWIIISYSMLLLLLCYRQVEVQRSGTLSFNPEQLFGLDNLDLRNLRAINAVEDRPRKFASPFWAMTDLQWKSWYRWIFWFTAAFCTPLVLLSNSLMALFPAGGLLLFLGYMGERRETSAFFCTQRPVSDSLIVRARHLNALRCAVQLFVVILFVGTLKEFSRYVISLDSTYYYAADITPLHLFGLLQETDSKLAIVLLYATIYALVCLVFWFLLSAGRYLILLTVFMGLSSLLASVALLPVGIMLNSLRMDLEVSIALCAIQFVLASYTAWQFRAAAAAQRISWRLLWPAITMTLIASLGILNMLYFTDHRGLADSAAVAMTLLMLGLIVTSLLDRLNRRTLVFMIAALVVSVLVPLPAVLLFGNRIPHELSVWSCMMFFMLSLPILCTPITIRWQRVQG